VRIGIGHPGHKALVTRHVLGDFARNEEPLVEDVVRAIAAHCDLLAAGEDASFQNKVHLAMAARGWTTDKE
jgi:PTH1 family peptidyl-tRNA hydrolase